MATKLVEFQVGMQTQESIHIHSHGMKNSDHPSHIGNLNIKTTESPNLERYTNKRAKQIEGTNLELYQTYLSNVVKEETFQRIGQELS